MARPAGGSNVERAENRVTQQLAQPTLTGLTPVPPQQNYTRCAFKHAKGITQMIHQAPKSDGCQQAYTRSTSDMYSPSSGSGCFLTACW